MRIGPQRFCVESVAVPGCLNTSIRLPRLCSVDTQGVTASLYLVSTVTEGLLKRGAHPGLGELGSLCPVAAVSRAWKQNIPRGFVMVVACNIKIQGGLGARIELGVDVKWLCYL